MPAVRTPIIIALAALVALTMGVSTAAAKVLKQGSRGDSVASVQKRVHVKADGVFGKKTKKAVKRFQKRKGLTADGIVGPRTFKALGLRPPKGGRGKTKVRISQGAQADRPVRVRRKSTRRFSQRAVPRQVPIPPLDLARARWHGRPREGAGIDSRPSCAEALQAQRDCALADLRQARHQLAELS